MQRVPAELVHFSAKLRVSSPLGISCLLKRPAVFLVTVRMSQVNAGLVVAALH